MEPFIPTSYFRKRTSVLRLPYPQKSRRLLLIKPAAQAPVQAPRQALRGSALRRPSWRFPHWPSQSSKPQTKHVPSATISSKLRRVLLRSESEAAPKRMHSTLTRCASKAHQLVLKQPMKGPDFECIDAMNVPDSGCIDQWERSSSSSSCNIPVFK